MARPDLVELSGHVPIQLDFPGPKPWADVWQLLWELNRKLKAENY
jgi:hypothetical protein